MTRIREGRRACRRFVHFEIPADDPQRADTFYHDVLGWEISRFGNEPYRLVRAGEDGEPGANGALVTGSHPGTGGNKGHISPLTGPFRDL